MELGRDGMAPLQGGVESDGPAGRSANAARCAVVLRDVGRSTVTEMGHRTGMSRPTVESAVSLLIERGLVRDDNGHTTGGRGAGRPARLYAFNAAAGYLVGVDVGIHRVRVAVADLAGQVIGWQDEPVDATFVGPGRMVGVKRIVRACLAESGVPVPKLVAMAVAVSGLVGEDGRLIVSRNISDWEGVDVAGHLRAEFHCAVAVENDMRLAALAEHRMGVAQLMDDVVYFFAGHRVSMGLIIDGKIRRGHHSAAGEVGDIIFGMQVNARGQLAWTSAPTGEDVFRQAGQGHTESMAEVERFVGGLAVGMATVVMTIDPDIVVIGGGLSRAGDVLLEPLRRAVNAEIPLPVHPTIIASELGAESVVLGSVARAAGMSGAVVFGVTGLPEPLIDAAQARSFAAASISA